MISCNDYHLHGRFCWIFFFFFRKYTCSVQMHSLIFGWIGKHFLTIVAWNTTLFSTHFISVICTDFLLETWNHIISKALYRSVVMINKTWKMNKIFGPVKIYSVLWNTLICRSQCPVRIFLFAKTGTVKWGLPNNKKEVSEFFPHLVTSNPWNV